MTEVSLRDFCNNPTKFLKQLPIILTQYNKRTAQVLPLLGNENESVAKPLVEELKTIPGITTADKLTAVPTQSFNASYQEVNGHWGNPKLHCQICWTSPAISYTYKDENSDEHEGIFCKRHLEEYERGHQSKNIFNTGRQIRYANLSEFNGSLPKPVKKKK